MRWVLRSTVRAVVAALVLVGCSTNAGARGELADALVRDGRYTQTEADCFVSAVDKSLGLGVLQGSRNLTQAELDQISSIARRCGGPVEPFRAPRTASAAGAPRAEEVEAQPVVADPLTARRTAIEDLRAAGFPAAVATCVIDALVAALGPQAVLPEMAADTEVTATRAQIAKECKR